jgi:hypothetical protein
VTTPMQPGSTDAAAVQLRHNYSYQDTELITLRAVDGHYPWSGAAELIDGFASRYANPKTAQLYRADRSVVSVRFAGVSRRWLDRRGVAPLPAIPVASVA